MTLGTRYFGIDLRTMTDAHGVKVAWWCLWYLRPRWNKAGPHFNRLGYLYGSVRNALPEEVSMPDPVDLTGYQYPDSQAPALPQWFGSEDLNDY